MLQKLLGVRSRVAPRDLCLQCGCVRLERLVTEMLDTFKHRYLDQLPPSQRDNVSLSKPVFVAAVFLAVARKHKFKVDKKKLLEPLGILGPEFASAAGAVDALLPELGASKPAKRKPAESGTAEPSDGVEAVAAAARLEATGCASSDEEVLDDRDVEARSNVKKRARREYEAWKEGVLEQRAAQREEGKENRPLNTAQRRQARLSFGKPLQAVQGTSAKAPATHC